MNAHAQPPLTKAQRHRAKLRAQGLRPVQLWVPDRTDPAFVAEMRRQCLVANAAEDEAEAQAFINAAIEDLWASIEN